MERTIEKQFAGYKEGIAAFLHEYFRKESPSYLKFPLDVVIFAKLTDFTTRGKMFRGGILLYVYELFHPDADRTQAVRAASALELLEAGILIQDDVMDRDELRRGQPAIWADIRDHTTDIRKESAESFGGNTAVCIGDVAYFLAFFILNGLEVAEDMKRAVSGLYAREMAALCLSQVQDLYLTSVARDVTEEETTEMYIAKTARYSWILPLETALILAGRTELAAQFERIGRFSGLVYQLVDDRIGLFGDERETGKTAGGDVREGKKTLYWHYTRKFLAPGDLRKFDAIYGRRDISMDDVDAVRAFVRSSGAYDKVELLTEAYLRKVQREISGLDVADSTKLRLREMISFISRRKF